MHDDKSVVFDRLANQDKSVFFFAVFNIGNRNRKRIAKRRASLFKTYPCFLIFERAFFSSHSKIKPISHTLVSLFILSRLYQN